MTETALALAEPLVEKTYFTEPPRVKSHYLNIEMKRQAILITVQISYIMSGERLIIKTAKEQCFDCAQQPEQGERGFSGFCTDARIITN